MTKTISKITCEVDIRTLGVPEIVALMEREQLNNVHAGTVVALAKPGKQILEDATQKAENQLIAAMQLFIEAGLRLDLAKKQYYYAKEQQTLQTDTTFLCQCEVAEEFQLRQDNAKIGDREQRAEKLHMAIGIAGEACELLEAIYNECICVPGTKCSFGERDRVNEVEELGDLEFYMQGFRRLAGITRDETLEANIDKLAKRYPVGSYSDAQAIARADKVDDIIVDHASMSPEEVRPVKENIGLEIQITGRADNLVHMDKQHLFEQRNVRS